VFIAGGISNCPDWQTELTSYMNTNKFDVVNPRRGSGFVMSNVGDAARYQITWEHDALSKVDACVFWFPKETLCPITLLEIGKMLVKASMNEVKLLVGYHEEYQRAFDIVVQIELEKIEKSFMTLCDPGWDAFVDSVKRVYS